MSLDGNQLKPDKLKLDGTHKLLQFIDLSKKKIIAADIPSVLKVYLTELIEHASTGAAITTFADVKKMNNWGIWERDINNNFMEILGPIHILKQRVLKSLSANADIFFPSKGNEGLYDFKVGDYTFSSKTAKSKTTNVVKPGDVLNLLNKNTTLKNQFLRSHKDELEAMWIVDTTSSKAGPAALADFLKKARYGSVTSTEKDPIKYILDLEKKSIDIMNTKMNFAPIIRTTLSGSVLYVKGKMTNTGSLYMTVSDPSAANPYWRSKNSPGHFKDKIGFQL